MGRSKILSLFVIALISLLSVAIPQAMAAGSAKTLTNPAPFNSGFFGTSVSTNGRYIVVGEPGLSGGKTYSFAGEAYVFTTSGKLVSKLKSPNPKASGRFGYSVSISGEYVVVGAPREDFNGIIEAGNAYVFTVSGRLVKTLSSPNAQYSGQFGSSVSISSLSVVVGAPQEAGGHAYIFTISGRLINRLKSPNALSPGAFGCSVSIDEGFVAVGEAGSAYIFTTSGKLVSKLTSPNTQTTRYFGWSVSIDGGLVAVGAPFENFNGLNSVGQAYIFTLRGELVRKLISPNPQKEGYFGWSVSISGNLVAIGAENEASNGVDETGIAYVFTVSGRLVKTLSSPNAQYSGQFGSSVSISGLSVVVGAPWESTGSYYNNGNAYIFS